MNLNTARQRIETAKTQNDQQDDMAIEHMNNEVQTDLGYEAGNELIDEFDLELQYNIAPLESDVSSNS